MALSDWEKEEVDCYVKARYGTEEYEILGAADMLWCGWECDTAAVLIRLSDGCRVWAVLGGVEVSPDTVPETLRQRISAYRQATAETEALLMIAGEM